MERFGHRPAGVGGRDLFELDAECAEFGFLDRCDDDRSEDANALLGHAGLSLGKSFAESVCEFVGSVEDGVRAPVVDPC
jgi:hypothetical protein